MEQQPAPNFDFYATSDASGQLSDYQGKQVVLYFYPKDSTPGCTTESKDFTALSGQFSQTNTVIFGISRDSLKSHEKFKAKYNMPFELISDPDETICRLFDVIQLKKFMGREYMGIERTTVLIDTQGVVKKIWRKVKVKEHAQAVLTAAQS